MAELTISENVAEPTPFKFEWTLNASMVRTTIFEKKKCIYDTYVYIYIYIYIVVYR